MIKSISIRSCVILLVLALGFAGINSLAGTELEEECKQRTADCNDAIEEAKMRCQTASYTNHPDAHNACRAAQNIAGQTCADAAEVCDDAADEGAND